MGRLTEAQRDFCHWRQDAQIGRYFVPGCMGGAVYGEGGCTCGSRKTSTSERLATLEDQVRELTARLAMVCEALPAGRAALADTDQSQGREA